MRWLAFLICVMISTYIIIAAMYSGWASSTPVSDAEHYKRFAFIYLMLSGSFLALGLCSFYWISKRKKAKK